MKQPLSPLRYPGGKAAIAPFLEDVIDLNNLRGCSYFEPYAGGAGAALTLLKNGVISEIHINDADIRIYSFWKNVLTEKDRFVDNIFSIPLTLDEWGRQKKICDNPENHSGFKIGFAAFYMNRCNRSGILQGAGPIGGKQQKGNWKLDVRFNREKLAERIITIAMMKNYINVYNEDAIKFLKQQLPKGRGRSGAFAYLDPPYVNKADKLYMNIYNEKDHRAIARYLLQQKKLHWVLSYDDTPLIQEIYNGQKICRQSLRYSLQSKRIAKELIISSAKVTLPSQYFEKKRKEAAA